MSFLDRTALVAALVRCASAGMSGPEAPQPAVPVAIATPAPSAGVVAAGGYKEMFCYSSVVRPNYVPCYTPHRSSLYENPREYPQTLCVMGTPYYQYGRIPGWFFGSPNGYQSSVPPGSHALAYHRGELGITEHLNGGYPEGLRVVERVLVPYSQYCRDGGFYISAGSATQLRTTTVEEVAQSVTTEVKAAAPAVPSPVPPRMPATPLPVPDK